MAHTKRIEAVQVIWSCILRITDSTPEAVVMTNYITAAEIANCTTRPKVAPILAALDQDVLRDIFQDRVRAGEARLLAGEYLYALYDAYRTIIGRAVHLTMVGRDAGKVPAWYEDQHVISLMSNIFTPDEMAQFRALDLAQLTWFRTNIERKFVERAELIATGQESALTAVAQARAIEAAASRLEPKAASVEALPDQAGNGGETNRGVVSQHRKNR
ncbi:MAG TPA: hypothetical protein VL242_42375 [Sorangium sp.]|nr:hypothetical protein [Sorangium sp.]